MSGRRPPERPRLEGYIGPDDVAKELNFLEYLSREMTSTDEYMDAMLTNQRLMLMQLMQQIQAENGRTKPIGAVDLAPDGSPAGFEAEVRPVNEELLVDNRQVPLESVGIANRLIYENDTGPATFQVNGTVFATEIRMTEDVGAGDPVRITAPGNIAENVGNVALSLLGLPGSVGVDTFAVDETDENVSIPPGETKTVLKVNTASGSWLSTGTNDETHSLYQYRLDGEDLLDEPLKEPLGLYNDPYSYPTPLSFSRSFSIVVTRQESADGAQEYFSKAAYLG